MTATDAQVLERAAELFDEAALFLRAQACQRLRGSGTLLARVGKLENAAAEARALLAQEPPQRVAGAPSGAEVDRMAEALRAAGYEVTVVDGRAV